MPPRSRPRITRTAAAAAATAIARRRLACDDPDREQLPDAELDLVRYVLGHQRVPDAVLAEDVLDALRLLEYVRATLPRLEHQLLTLGRSVGVTQATMAGPMGLGGKQAVQNRILRLAAYLRDDPDVASSEHAERRARRAEHAEEQWLRSHGPELRQAVAALLRSRPAEDLLGDALAGDLDDLEEVLENLPGADHPRYAQRLQHLAAAAVSFTDGLAAIQAASHPVGQPGGEDGVPLPEPARRAVEQICRLTRERYRASTAVP